MSLKLKVLGLGLLAVMATSAFAVNASATKSGHFVADPSTHTLTPTGTESYNPDNPSSTPHNLSFFRMNATGTATEPAEQIPIKCTHVDYHGETLTGAAATTTQVVRVRPTYTGCSTGATAVPHDITVHVPTSCETNVFEFTSGNTGTVHVNCTITITHPNCEIVIPNNAENKSLHGITYDTIVTDSKHALTVTSAVKKIRGYFHGGICIFLGTSKTFEMVGSATVWADDAAGNVVNVTHTDP